MRTAQALIDILEPTPDTVDALMKLDFAAGRRCGNQGVRSRSEVRKEN